MELVRENIECEQLLGENSIDTVVRADYVVPDTHPDVVEILMLDAKPCIVNKEVMQDKVFIEGQVEYNIMYLAKEEDKYGIYNITYASKFSNTIDVLGAGNRMQCEAECYVEHMEKMIINERKIGVEGIIKLKCEVYKNYEFQIVKDVIGVQDMQLLKNPGTIDKIVGTVGQDLIAKSHIEIPKDKPQIGAVIKCDIMLHKREVRVYEGKVQASAFARVELLYRGKDSREVSFIEDDVFINKEADVDGVDSTMECFSDFRVDAMNVDIKEDDLGENRIVDLEAVVKANTKVMSKNEMDMIEDAYSPTMMLDMAKKNYELNVMHGYSSNEAIVKGNIEMAPGMPKPQEVVMVTGKVSITDKKIVEDKVVIEGLLNVEVMYRVDDEKYLETAVEEMPFASTIEIPGAKIDMHSVTKAALENIEAVLEGNSIAIKGVVNVTARVNYLTNKEFLVDIVPQEGELPKKMASVTIYVVQSGDTLWKIAKRYYTTVEALTKVNELDDFSPLRHGQKLIIPGRAIM